MATPTVEDYLERIYELTRATGTTRPTDVARALGIRQPTVTQMARRLRDGGFITWEPYRDIALTPRGERLGRDVQKRHRRLTAFLAAIGVEDERRIWRDVEGIEHHASPATMAAIDALVRFFEAHPECHAKLVAFRRRDARSG